MSQKFQDKDLYFAIQWVLSSKNSENFRMSFKSRKKKFLKPTFLRISVGQVVLKYCVPLYVINFPEDYILFFRDITRKRHSLRYLNWAIKFFYLEIGLCCCGATTGSDSDAQNP